MNFALELSDLRHRHGFRIILVHKNQASEALLHHAHELICFEEFISDLPPRLPLKMLVKILILDTVDISKCQIAVCCDLGGEQAEMVLIMMGDDCCVFGHCLFQLLPCECMFFCFQAGRILNKRIVN